jgi:hypothetical protein
VADAQQQYRGLERNTLHEGSPRAGNVGLVSGTERVIQRLFQQNIG